MITPYPARPVFMLAMLAMLSGCATGSSLSISQAPLSFVLTDDGAYEIAAQQDGTAQALAENGDIEHGIAGYDLLGGNALLPVSAVASASILTPASGLNALGPTTASLSIGPAQAAVNANVAGTLQAAADINTAALSSTTSGILATAGTAVGAPATSLSPVTSALAPATAALAPVTSVAGTATNGALASAAPVTAPVTAVANQSLTAVSSILGSVAPPAAAPASAPNNPILATIAAALGRRCC